MGRRANRELRLVAQEPSVRDAWRDRLDAPTHQTYWALADDRRP